MNEWDVVDEEHRPYKRHFRAGPREHSPENALETSQLCPPAAGPRSYVLWGEDLGTAGFGKLGRVMQQFGLFHRLFAMFEASVSA